MIINIWTPFIYDNIVLIGRNVNLIYSVHTEFAMRTMSKLYEIYIKFNTSMLILHIRWTNFVRMFYIFIIDAACLSSE